MADPDRMAALTAANPDLDRDTIKNLFEANGNDVQEVCCTQCKHDCGLGLPNYALI